MKLVVHMQANLNFNNLSSYICDKKEIGSTMIWLPYYMNFFFLYKTHDLSVFHKPENLRFITFWMSS